MTDGREGEGLLPCPFCGGKAKEEWRSGGRAHHRIFCLGCQASTGWANIGHDASAYRDWNTRLSGWRDIASAPRDGTSIVFWEPPKSPVVGYLSQCLGYGWQSIPGDKRYKPTLWMPLPPAPQGEGK